MAVPPSPPVRGDRELRRAWWSFVLFVPSTIAAFVVGEGLLAVLGHGSEETVPLGVALAAGLPAIVVFTLPTLSVWRFSRLATRCGHPSGRTPLIVALTVTGCFLAVNLFQLIAGLLL